MPESYEPMMGLEQRTLFRENLINDMRSELIHLKSFQIQLITFGITGSGIFLGLLKEFGAFPQYCFFLPLLMLFPFWIIFFEKARTIARNIGFIRLQEKMCLSGSAEALIGFETAMHKYWKEKGRKLDDNTELNAAIQKIHHERPDSIKTMHASHYWFTTYLVFFIFSFICLVFSLIHQVFTFGIITVILCLFPLAYSVFIVLYGHHLLEKYPGYHREGGKFVTGFTYGHLFVYGILFGIYLIVLLAGAAEVPATSVPAAMAGKTPFDPLFIPVYLFASAVFNFVSIFTYWFFYNLVKGRYTHTVFERKWCEILNLQADGLIDQDDWPVRDRREERPAEGSAP